MTYLTRAISKLPSAAEIRSRGHERVDKLSEREGWLSKVGELNKLQQKRRFFVLHSDRLLYFKTIAAAQKGPQAAQGFISLFGKTVIVEDRNRAHGLLLTAYDGGRIYQLVAADDTDRDLWINSISKLLPKLPSAPELEKEDDILETDSDVKTLPGESKDKGKPRNVDPRSLKEGWLMKEGIQIKSWRRRYFVVLPDGIILYFKSQAAAATGSTKSQGTIVLFPDSVIANESIKPHSFSVLPSSGSRKYMFQTGSDSERDLWVSFLMGVLPQLSTVGDRKIAPNVSVYERPSDAEAPSTSHT